MDALEQVRSWIKKPPAWLEIVNASTLLDSRLQDHPAVGDESHEESEDAA